MVQGISLGSLYRIEVIASGHANSCLCFADSEEDARSTYEKMNSVKEPMVVLDVKPEK